MTRKSYIITVAAFLSAVLMSGCASAPKITEKTLINIYSDKKTGIKENPVILIPGVFGTVLREGNSGKVIWGNIREGLINELELPIDSSKMPENKDSVEPVKTIKEFSWMGGLVKKEIYERIQDVAENAAGYTPGVDAFSLSYDWRRDLVEGAQRLGALIDEIKLKTGRQDLKFNLVCHSAGGLIARYYAKYGTVDVLDGETVPQPTYAGAKNINKIIMLGTPNRGAIESFKDIHKGLLIPGIGYVPKKAFFSMPSGYELMPFDGDTAFIDAKGNDSDVSLYDPANWENYGWSVFGSSDFSEEERARQRKFIAVALKRASMFQKALWSGDPEEERKLVTYIVLGSDANLTLDKALLSGREGHGVPQFYPDDAAIKNKAFAQGDGTVTRKSLLGTHTEKGSEKELVSAYEIFFAQDHIDMPNDPTFLDNVLHSLLDKKN